MLQFNVFADAHLIKSGNATTPYRVGGIITTEDRDDDGEIVKAVDWSYFTGGFGKIKYEHKEYKGPDAIIGFPTKLIKKGRVTEFEGELIKFDPSAPEATLTSQQRLAKSTVTLLQHIDEHNKMHPDNLQRAGWSIEGNYLELDPKTKVAKAQVVDVVFTTKPKNKKSLAKILKSLEAGYGTSPDTQTGFGATRKESIEKDTKQQFKNSRGKKMKNREEVYKAAIAKGKSKEDALKEADEYSKQESAEYDEKQCAAEKSLGASKEKFQKALEFAKSVGTVEVILDADESKKKLTKSLAKNDKGEIEDIGDFLEESQNVSLVLMKAIDGVVKKVDALAKSVETIAEGLAENDHNVYIVKSVDLLRNDVEVQRKGLVGLGQGLAKSMGFSTAKLVGTQFVDNTGGEQKELTKAQTMEVLDKLVEAGKVDDIEAMGYEGSGIFVNESTKNLVMEKAKEMNLIK